MPIYTGRGDDGSTGLIGGARVAKDDALIEAIGAVDELNAWLGELRSLPIASDPAGDLLRAQAHLMEIGAELAGAGGSVKLSKGAVRWLEGRIDAYEAELPPLRSFLLPGGGPHSARAHLARTVARRAERCVVRFHRSSPVRNEILQYINRLSDWLFVLARRLARDSGEGEQAWPQ